MPDRSIPFFNLILKCEKKQPGDPVLPAGYTFRMYADGDAREWARLEYEIGDFDSVEAAEQYFLGEYCSPTSDISDRCVFVENPDGVIVGSCIAWRDFRGTEQAASLHWLVVSPAFQGIGLGRALLRRAMQIFSRNREFPVYIHTQPWSYPAIVLYLREGFRLQETDTFSHYENQYSEAMNVLKGILSAELYRELEEKTTYSLPRCRWVNLKNPRYVSYHDKEWGVPCHDEHALYELLILESFQAGLSWETILNKRENFRAAFDGFDIDRVCAYGEEKLALLGQDKGIVRNRRKIEASVSNSRIFRQIQAEYGSWDRYIWGFTDGSTICEDDPAITASPLSDRISEDLRKRGMRFVGSTILYSYLQAIGVINAHGAECRKHTEGERLSIPKKRMTE